MSPSPSSLPGFLGSRRFHRFADALVHFTSFFFLNIELMFCFYLFIISLDAFWFTLLVLFLFTYFFLDVRWFTLLYLFFHLFIIFFRCASVFFTCFIHFFTYLLSFLDVRWFTWWYFSTPVIGFFYCLLCVIIRTIMILIIALL